jgi:hypothetical protein
VLSTADDVVSTSGRDGALERSFAFPAVAWAGRVLSLLALALAVMRIAAFDVMVPMISKVGFISPDVARGIVVSMIVTEILLGVSLRRPASRVTAALTGVIYFGVSSAVHVLQLRVGELVVYSCSGGRLLELPSGPLHPLLATGCAIGFVLSAFVFLTTSRGHSPKWRNR